MVQQSIIFELILGDEYKGKRKLFRKDWGIE